MENYYSKIIEHYKNQRITNEDEIAFRILKDIIPIKLLDFAFENMSEEQQEEYYNSLIDDSKKQEESFDNFDKLVKEYDNIRKQEDKYWNKLRSLKPEDMNENTFHSMIQEARYERKQKEDLINAFNEGRALDCKKLINHGARKKDLYDYVNNSNLKLTMNQIYLLEDLHNTKSEKHFPYEFDKYVCDPKIITSEEYNRLLCKFENYEKFTVDELAHFLIEHNDKTFTAIDNTHGNLYTEDFSTKEMALRYLDGESIDDLRTEECKYEVSIYGTEEDYEKGEPFQHNVYSSFEEAEKVLVETIKFNNYYSGCIINQATGEEVFNYSEEHQADIELDRKKTSDYIADDEEDEME